MKTFQYLNKSGEWVTTQDKKTSQEQREAGVPLRVLHDSGSFKVFANADKLPEGMEASFRATA